MREHFQIIILVIAANTAKFSGAKLETLAAEAALLVFDEGRPQQVTLGDLESCYQTITPLLQSLMLR
ncbi:hypothetical protein [Nostoc sp. MG11]|uniref:hypothetical protein n=1 Tax=Nostoc sp. MG11 TaxID=2721166 RepID=UPI0039B6FA01